MDNSVITFTIGHHDEKRPLAITAETVASAHASGYDILTTPITTEYFQRRVLGLVSNPAFSDLSSIAIPSLSPLDTPLTPDDTISQLVGVTASWIDLGSPDPLIADISRQVLQLELAYAAFCGLSHVVVHGPKLSGVDTGGSRVVQYARAILDALGQGPFMTIYIWFPMIKHDSLSRDLDVGDLDTFASAKYSVEEDSSFEGLDVFGTWQAWDIIRSICKYSTRLCVALSIPRLLPPTPIQSRWFSEPVRILSIGSEVFVKNPKGYPVLSKAHQALVFRFVQTKQPSVWFLLSNVGPIPLSDATLRPSDPSEFPSLAQASNTPHLKDPTPHLSYLRNLQTKLPQRAPVEVFGAGYQDYLQAPLQPLTVNLESMTYEVFERDPVKYEWYERAVARALSDWIDAGKPTSNPDGRVVVAVVGAGRGPLVTRALQASEAVGVDIDMWALEKNPNAYVLLQRHNETKWEGNVNLVKSDMRTWRGPVRAATSHPVSKIYNIEPDNEEEAELLEQTNATQLQARNTGDEVAMIANSSNKGPVYYKIDILISELLGSFADNELSPECLDGVQHLMNPTHGISIPASYTAHMTPIAAPKLHADISLHMIHTNPTAAEVPYVVMFNAIDFLSTENNTTSSAELPSKPSSSRTQSSADHQSNSQTQQSTLPDPLTTTTTKTDNNTNQPNTASQVHYSPIPSTQLTPLIHQTWSFHHPNPHLPSSLNSTSNSNPSIEQSITNAHNTRHSITTFPIPNRATCHGLAGYFESVLYKGVELSTNPLTMTTKSPDMISWFPIFFPLKTPIHCPDDSTMTVQMWRRTDDRKVWYEWIVDVHVNVNVNVNANAATAAAAAASTSTTTKDLSMMRHNNTRKVRVGGSELHSSEKEGCLM